MLADMRPPNIFRAPTSAVFVLSTRFRLYSPSLIVPTKARSAVNNLSVSLSFVIFHCNVAVPPSLSETTGLSGVNWNSI